LVLGYISDSDACLDCVKENIDAFTNFVVDRLDDSSFIVKEAAGETVGRLSEYVVPDFLDKHKKVMPYLMRVVKDLQNSKHDMTVQKTLFALNEFVGNLDYDIKLYLDDVITLLMGYVQATHFSRDVKYWALVSLSSTIGCAQKKIIPYTDGLMNVFSAIVTAPGSIAE